MIRLSRQQVRRVDELSILRYGLPGIVLMENAAREVTRVALEMVRHIDLPGITIVCGGGNNGGDGLAIARHLHNAGIDVRIFLALSGDRFSGDARVNWDVVRQMKLLVTNDLCLRTPNTHLMIDALFGTGLIEPPREQAMKIIEAMNKSEIPILSVDLPSGMDCDTGKPLGDCVRAKKTVTFVAQKLGFANPESEQYTGDIVIGDIGCPRELVDIVLKENEIKLLQHLQSG